MIVKVIYLVTALCVAQAALSSRLQLRYSWKVLDFAYPDEKTREHAIRSGAFVPENALPVGMEVWNDKVFVTVPRWRSGIPSTLNYFSQNSFTDSPKLTPYPDWSTNREGNCAGLTTTYRIKVDACDRLWVLDSGTVGIGNTTEQVCPVALHVFDLTTDKEIRRYQYRPEDTNDRTFIANIAVDIGSSCDDTFVYASDELGYGLLVYNYAANTSYRVVHPYFMPDPLAGDYNVAGINFQWGEEGIFGMSLSPIKADGFRTLFFHPLSSNREFAVSTGVLRNQARATAEESYHDYQVLDERSGLAHSTAEVQTDDGIMFYNLVDHNAVGCWNSRNPYKPEYQGVVDRDDVGLVFPADVKVDAKNNLWVMSDRMPVFLLADLDFNDVNFYIYSMPVEEAIRGTVCDLKPGQSSAISAYTPQIRTVTSPLKTGILQQPRVPLSLRSGPVVLAGSLGQHSGSLPTHSTSGFTVYSSDPSVVLSHDSVFGGKSFGGYSFKRETRPRTLPLHFH